MGRNPLHSIWVYSCGNVRDDDGVDDDDDDDVDNFALGGSDAIIDDGPGNAGVGAGPADTADGISISSGDADSVFVIISPVLGISSKWSSVGMFVKSALKPAIHHPLQHTSLQERCITVAVHCNVAVWLQYIAMLQFGCRLHCNITATLWKHCRGILQCTYLCNVSGILRTYCRAILRIYCDTTHVERSCNVDLKIRCNIALVTYERRSCNDPQ